MQTAAGRAPQLRPGGGPGAPAAGAPRALSAAAPLPPQPQPQRRNAPRAPRAASGTRGGSGGAGSVAEMSAQMRQMRSRMERDEQLGALMAGFRGSNLDAADFARADTAMNFVDAESGADGELPLAYDPAAIAAYWDARPVSAARRVVQLTSIAGSFLSGLLMDVATGRVKQNEVARAIELREIVTSLGPAYIKLGQALSIRPDLLSPAAMGELQKLCDKVPSFDSAIAMQVTTRARVCVVRIGITRAYAWACAGREARVAALCLSSWVLSAASARRTQKHTTHDQHSAPPPPP